MTKQVYVDPRNNVTEHDETIYIHKQFDKYKEEFFVKFCVLEKKMNGKYILIVAYVLELRLKSK